MWRRQPADSACSGSCFVSGRLMSEETEASNLSPPSPNSHPPPNGRPQSPEDAEKALRELEEICALDKFKVELSSPEEESEEDEVQKPSTRNRRRERRRKGRKNPFVIESFTNYGQETAFPEEEEDDLVVDEEILRGWEQYWAENGEAILWSTWEARFRDYINPEYDFVAQLKEISICGVSSSSEEEEDDTMPRRQGIKKPRNIFNTDAENPFNKVPIPADRKRKREEEEGEKDNQEQAAAELWQKEWEEHASKEHSAAYKRYIADSRKQRRISLELKDEVTSRKEIQKYYSQRYDFFSKWNEGIKLDYESWFSVTPEPIARAIAQRFMMQLGKDIVVLDPLCGCGGNVIQFATFCAKVIAIDIDPLKIENCRHNARIYGVEDKIEFIVGDFMQLAPSLKADAVFISPPWGGPEYLSAKAFNIKTMLPMDGFELFEMAQKISPNVAYFLPRNVDREQVTELARQGEFVEFQENRHLEKVKTITVYFGNLIDWNVTAG